MAKGYRRNNHIEYWTFVHLFIASREHSIITLAEKQTPPPLQKPQWDKCPVGQMSGGQMSSGTVRLPQMDFVPARLRP